MTIDDLLGRLDGVRKTTKGWTAQCPSHQDRHPSLSIREGDQGILIYCFSGCTLDAICAALGLDVKDLFYDTRDTPSRRTLQSEPRPLTIRELEYQVWVRATSLELRALNVLDAAKGLDTGDWSDADFDVAMRAAYKAREDLRLAERLHSLASAMRETLNPQRGVADEDRTRVA